MNCSKAQKCNVISHESVKHFLSSPHLFLSVYLFICSQIYIDISPFLFLTCLSSLIYLLIYLAPFLSFTHSHSISLPLSLPLLTFDLSISIYFLFYPSFSLPHILFLYLSYSLFLSQLICKGIAGLRVCPVQHNTKCPLKVLLPTLQLILWYYCDSTVYFYRLWSLRFN